MEIDPHTLQQILHRIENQMRCPQCGKDVPVDFAAVRVIADSAMILQLKCEQCDAYIVLHAQLQGIENISAEPYQVDETANSSSTIDLDKDQLDMLKGALEQSGGSFQDMFDKFGHPQDGDADQPEVETDEPTVL